MRKIFVSAYLNKNLGDDLFLKILSERYNNNFILYCDPKKKYNNFLKNMKYNKSQLLYYTNKMIEKITNRNIHRDFIIKNSPLIITIGGSMFIEKSNNKKILEKKYDIYKHNKPSYIIGVNFGPYNTEQYKKYITNNVFKKSTDICFREKFSYNLFNDNSNVRYAPDIVFSLNTDNIEITNDKTAIISVIDCTKRFEKNISDNYENKIIELIKELNERQYKITLMSFCKEEGDEHAIELIMDKINDKKIKKSINYYYYNGNINEALNIIGKSQIIVASRFHATILGLVMKKTVIPVAYSNKTINVLNDLGFKGKIFDIRKPNDFDVKKLNDKDFSYKFNVDKYKKEAEGHFKKLDLILNKTKKSSDIDE